jgi:hypothetical protein
MNALSPHVSREGPPTLDRAADTGMVPSKAINRPEFHPQLDGSIELRPALFVLA